MFMPIIVGAVAFAFILVIISFIGPKKPQTTETTEEAPSVLGDEITAIKEENASLKSQLEEEKQNETKLAEEINTLKAAPAPEENTEILKAENATLKDTLMTKENQNKQLIDEVNALKEKIKGLETVKEEPAAPQPKPEEVAAPEEKKEDEEKPLNEGGE